jgi:hypothetical protein
MLLYQSIDCLYSLYYVTYAFWVYCNVILNYSIYCSVEIIEKILEQDQLVDRTKRLSL